MPDLYRLHAGPVNAAYYQRHFQRFESSGQVAPSWNHGAAFFTLAWLLLRKLWRPAGMYAGVVLALLALWWWGLHGRMPLAAEAAAGMVALLLLCVLPGLAGNGLYYQHVRRQTLQTLTRATSVSQARVQLAHHAVTPERLQAVAALQALAALGLGAALVWAAQAPGQLHADAPSAPAAAVSGPPDLVIPATGHLPPLELLPFAPADTAAPAKAGSPAPVTPDAAPATPLLPTMALASPAPPSPPANPPPAISATAPPAAASRPPAAAAKVAPGSTVAASQYYLNAGVYAQASNAEAAIKKLQAAKLPIVRQTVSSKNGDLTRLRIGPFETRKQAEQAATRAKKLRIDTTLAPPAKT